MFDRDLFGGEAKPDAHGSLLATAWEYPPFSVLNAREGWWQERKRQWLALGIKSELGRGETTSNGGGAEQPRPVEARGQPVTTAINNAAREMGGQCDGQ